MAFVPENTLNEILSRIDIVELISEYLPLKRSGRGYTALCPFHHEKTPSFIVSQQKQIFHCFGCQAGGNAFGFLMKYDRLEFPEAVETLAKRAGVLIPRDERQIKNQGISQELHKINEIAADFYSNLLHSPEGAAALNYLKKRGMSPETIRAFRLGYAPDKWDGLLNYLRSKNIPLSLIEKAGLIIAKDNQGYYDRFRQRIIVPISDVRNRVIAFGARVLDNSLPKYINSPETAVYSKSKTLFGLNLSKEAIITQDCAVIVEGYFDLIAPFQAGITNIAASCGTALTTEQVRLLKRYSRNIVMIYDADDAGQSATMRSLEMLAEEDMNVKVVRLEKGYDPDAYIRHSGPEGFRDLITGAKDSVDYMLDTLKAKYDPADISQKARIASEILPLVAKFKNEILKSEYLKKLSRELGVSESSLTAEIKKTKTPGYTDKRENSAGPRPDSRQAKSFCAESMLVKILLEENELIEHLREKILPKDFKDNRLSRIIARMFELSHDKEIARPQSLLNHFSETEVSQTICELAASELPEISDKLKLLNDCVNKIKEKSRKSKQEDLCEQIRLAQHSKDENRIYQLLNEFKFLTKKGCE